MWLRHMIAAHALLASQSYIEIGIQIIRFQFIVAYWLQSSYFPIDQVHQGSLLESGLITIFTQFSMDVICYSSSLKGHRDS